MHCPRDNLRLTLIPCAPESLTILTSRRVTTGFHVTSHARGGIRISFHTATTQVLVTMPTYFTKKNLSPAGQLGIQQSGHTSKIDHNPSRPAPQFQPPSARAQLCPLQPRARPWQCPTPPPTCRMAQPQWTMASPLFSSGGTISHVQ